MDELLEELRATALQKLKNSDVAEFTGNEQKCVFQINNGQLLLFVNYLTEKRARELNRLITYQAVPSPDKFQRWLKYVRSHNHIVDCCLCRLKILINQS